MLQSSIFLTLKLASVSTLVLLIICVPTGFGLSRWKGNARILVDTLVALPIVLPPTVLGFYLLLLMGPQGWVGQLLEKLGLTPLPFSFMGLVCGSVLYSLPFVLQPIQQSFEAMGRMPWEVAASLGANPWQRFYRVGLPLATPGIFTGAILGFAHTLGEFGVVLMLGGNIPGKTRVMSIAIFEHVEAMEYTEAHQYAAFLLGLSFAILFLFYWLKRQGKWSWRF